MAHAPPGRDTSSTSGGASADANEDQDRLATCILKQGP